MADRPKKIYAVNEPTHFVLVDARDYDALLGIKPKGKRKRKSWEHFRRGHQRIEKATREWRMDRSGFFYCGVPPAPVMWMHREILQVPAGKFVGFRDGDERNLRRMNLVLCNTREQAHSYKHAAIARAMAPQPT